MVSSRVQTGGDPSSAGVMSEAAPEAHLVIWGTDVNIQDTKKQFRTFLETFIDDLPSEGGDSPTVGEDRVEPYYLQRLDEVSHLTLPWQQVYIPKTLFLVLNAPLLPAPHPGPPLNPPPPPLPGPPQINILEEPFLTVNCEHLLRVNPDLYSQLVRYPQEVIPTFDLATNELFNKLYPDTVLAHQIQVYTVLAHQIQVYTILAHQIQVYTVLAHQIQVYTILAHQIQVYAVLAHQIQVYTIPAHQIQLHCICCPSTSDTGIRRPSTSDRSMYTA